MRAMAKDRETRIPEQFDPQPEGWQIDGDPVRVQEGQEDQLYAALEDAVTILRHIGGTMQIVPVRIELGPGVFKTVEYAFRWNSFVPPLREPKLAHEAPEEPEPEPEQEPALAA